MIQRALRLLPPETAHGAALAGLRAGLGPRRAPRAPVDLLGLRLPNPVGLAAGFDKNAVAVAPLLRAGFGFVEVGAVTPLPQPGNARPRLFRLDRAVINRFGFNNDGAAAVAPRIAGAPGVVGVNLGANKDSANRVADFARVAEAMAAADFLTINVSSPNTAELRALQSATALGRIVDDVRAAYPGPLFVKVAPDLDRDGLHAVADLAAERGLGIIATNTTLSRDGARGRHVAEAGGLSGRPLFRRATQVLAQLWLRSEGAVPLIGVGGVEDAATAAAKIAAGATAIQLYTALAWRGLGVLPELVAACRGQAVGAGAETWASSAG